MPIANHPNPFFAGFPPDCHNYGVLAGTQRRLLPSLRCYVHARNEVLCTCGRGSEVAVAGAPAVAALCQLWRRTIFGQRRKLATSVSCLANTSPLEPVNSPVPPSPWPPPDRIHHPYAPARRPTRALAQGRACPSESAAVRCRQRQARMHLLV